MIETLACIDAPHFYAGVVLVNDRVIEAADIVGYMKRKKWTRDQVRAYCVKKGWKVSVVYQVHRERQTASASEAGSSQKEFLGTAQSQ